MTAAADPPADPPGPPAARDGAVGEWDGRWLTWVRRRPAPSPGLVHVSSGAAGGAVAGLLRGLTREQAADGTPVGWAVVTGTDAFASAARLLRDLLRDRADPAALADPDALRAYRSVLAALALRLADGVGVGDVVVLHDPPTLGLAPHLAGLGARVLWHCHVGTTAAGARGPAAVWRALAPELSTVDAVVSALPEFAPPTVSRERRHVFPPAIDPWSPRNRELHPDEVEELLGASGLTSGLVDRDPAVAVEQRGPVPSRAQVVLQVSRWRRREDLPGLLLCVPLLPPGVHVVLAGGHPGDGPGDREGRAVLDAVRASLDGLSIVDRLRTHLVLTSARHPDRAGLLLNALQRRSDVVLQRSLEETFDLTVTEAMAKRRAVVAADVGGLRQQVIPGRTGLLVDPADRHAVVAGLRTLLEDTRLRRDLADRAAETVAGRHTVARLAADYRRFAPAECLATLGPLAAR